MVDFGYAFSTPHRLTVCLPDSSQKTLLDVEAGAMRMAWSTDDLRQKPLAAFMAPRTNWQVFLKPEIDGRPFTTSKWTRSEGWLPVLLNSYTDKVSLDLETVGGNTAAITRVSMINRDNVPHNVGIRCESPGGWKGFNPGWVQSDWDRDILLAGWEDRADRIVVFALGADRFDVPTPNTVHPTWTLEPGKSSQGWIVRPYQAYQAMVPGLRTKDWLAEFEEGKHAWRVLMANASTISIPDVGVQNAFQACLADCFVMSEEVANGEVVSCPGTEIYRAPEPFEPLIASVLMDQVGLHKQAFDHAKTFYTLQGEDGNWADPQGWIHMIWGTSGIKSWAIMEHFRLTGDQTFLAEVYPRMAASSRWQESQRAKTCVLKNGEKPLTYGLMPRGMGDAGLIGEDGSHYGVFLSCNIQAVFADAMTVEAARALGKTKDLPALIKIHQSGLEDLLQALDRGAIDEDGYRWIPCEPGHAGDSKWGVLYAAFPCKILPPDHELITGTIRKIEAHISPGGIPIGIGWMKDGMWVAITLDNLAETLLFRGEGDAAIKYLYATLNHGTPLYSWCEERGQEPGAKKTSGDRQHLWTPAAVGRFIRDALILENEDTLHLAMGTDRSWLEQGKTIAVKYMPTYFGQISYEISSDVDNDQIHWVILMPARQSLRIAVLHCRHPMSLPIKSVTVNGKNWPGFEPESIYLEGMTGSVTVSVRY